jgi:hypothetical protein
VLSLDPGDMDTPLHAQAVPDADPSTLKQPAVAARELVSAIVDALPRSQRIERRRSEGVETVAV